MTTQEAADRLGISVKLIRAQCGRWKHRRIPAPDGSVGRRYVYDISDDELHLFRFAMRLAIARATKIRGDVK